MLKSIAVLSEWKGWKDYVNQSFGKNEALEEIHFERFTWINPLKNKKLKEGDHCRQRQFAPDLIHSV